jgi:hypothetical protein
MARLLTCGWETGLANEGGAATNGGSGASVPAIVTSNPSPRSGSYCLKCVSGGSTNAYSQERVTLPGNPVEILGRALFLQVSKGGVSNDGIVRCSDSAGTSHIYLTADPSSGAIKAYRGTMHTGTLLATGSAPSTVDEWNLIEFRVSIDDSTGVVQVKLNGDMVIDFAGDTRNGGNAEIGFVDFGCYTGSSLNASPTVSFDDVAINDTAGDVQNSWPGDGAVLLLKPSGNGNSSQLVGSDGNQVDNYALVDEVPANSADYVASSTADQQDTYALEDVGDPYKSVILAQPIAYAALAAAGTGALRTVVRAGETDYADEADRSLGTSYQFIRGDVRYTHPSGAAWSLANFNAIESGPRVR